MAQARAMVLIGSALAVCAGCAKPPQAPPNYVVPIIGLPPIPIDETRPGIDVRPIPTAETMAATEHVVSVAPEVQAALLERRPVRLGYPPEALQRKLSGYVRFRVVIGRGGTVEGLTLVETTNILFVRPATASVETWQYRPYLLNGRPVAVDTFVRVDFEVPE